MNKRYKVCPLFWSDYGDERTLMNMGVFEELLNEGWKILRVDMENLQTMCRSCNSRKGNRLDVVQGG